MHKGLRISFAISTLALIATSALADDTGFAYSHDLVKDGGRLCMKDHFHSGYGDGPTKSAAERAAIRSWAEFTAFEYGTVWARYSLAKSRATKYTKADKGWSANVDARPCRG
jgi:hypothetical protein